MEKVLKETIDDRRTGITATMQYLFQGGAHPEFIIETIINLHKAENLDYTNEDINRIVYEAWEEYGRGKADSRLCMKADVLGFIASSNNGSISLHDCYRAVNAITKDQMSAVRMAMKRICQMGIVEPTGNKSGVYRKIEKVAPPIDFFNITGNPIDIKWPFGIEKYCFILPKNIIILTGNPDTGKTAFLLNVIFKNMNKHKIYYFSSEMGALELKSRLMKFPLPLEAWQFSPKERSYNFADVIMPDDINIIDFLEIHKDFYLIGQWIKDIYDKLNNGIAIIAIQKNINKDQDLARGGVGSLEKARLYLSMSSNPHILKIIKAKNWVNEMTNPNGMFIRYKIVQGSKFIYDKDLGWEREPIKN